MKRYLLELAAFLASLLFWVWLYGTFFYTYVATVFYKGWPEEDRLIPAGIILLLTLLSFLFIRSLTRQHLPRWLIWSSYGLYFLVLFYTLFLKNIGLQGFSLNLQSFVYLWIYGDKLVPTMNVIMFIPLGFLCRPSWKSAAIFTLAISLVEGSQYLFHLGIFDLGDILTNLLGFVIGSCLLQSRWGKWASSHIH
ncbi:VanZ family protein [Streptococcus panodentis]|uniref:VanZ family protein n=1 Tax=Streptococcus panodentis TaxID=1581472 RepID=A0ABS5B046_9STRE|nr:VanZ family protein [Streptococcus panodentis]MBP2622198.1 VanZ family protein [Streptococcus panodentis]